MLCGAETTESGDPNEGNWDVVMVGTMPCKLSSEVHMN
jgi:hypothetical protein